MSRHLAREKALQMLFQMDIGQNSWEMAKMTLDEAELSEPNRNFAMMLVEGTRNNLTELDFFIQRYTEQWDIERLANVDKNVIRLALFEIKFLPDIPTNVSINEAIELAKTFSSDEAAKFVNGILDAICHESDQ